MQTPPTQLRITGRNRFCGPAVLAAVANITTDEAAWLIREQTKKRAVYGVTKTALLSAIQSTGLNADYYAFKKGMYTVNSYSKTPIYGLYPRILHGTGHWLALWNGLVYDNWKSNRCGTTIDKYQQRLKRLKGAIAVYGTITRDIKAEYEKRERERIGYLTKKSQKVYYI
jgi:hypothetical protein